MLKTLQKLTQDKTSKSHCFDDNLRQDPVQYIEYLYLSNLEIAGKVRGIHVKWGILFFSFHFFSLFYV
jgi:hypothetical protein